ncbi:MAG: ABC transporter ATP-binding protein [Actinomycetota bacterium]
MAGISLEGITKDFGAGAPAVDDVTLEIADGEFMVLVGPSGCGKSTILRIIAGLEDVTAGEVVIGDRRVTDLLPKERDVAMVFQNYALYPHMTVAENIGFGLRLRHAPREEIARRVAETARILSLESLLERKPVALSGGQRQRVAMGRAMVREPKAFLMDEPLSNLDAKLRVQMRAELARLRDRLRTTTVYVTHDQVEAMTLGDRVAVLKDGVLQQVDTPQRLFHRPTNLFVAAFIGSPSMNLVEARVDGEAVSFASLTFPVPDREELHAYDGRTVILGIRPSDLEDASLLPREDVPALEVVPDVIEELGTEIHAIFAVDAPPVVTEDTEAALEEDGGGLTPLGDGKATFTASLDPRSRAEVRRPIRLTVDPASFHFFDPESGRAIAGEPEAGVDRRQANGSVSAGRRGIK